MTTVGGWVDALDSFLVQDKERQDAERFAQRGEKDAFYASEIGYGARKVFYTFFADIPTSPESGRGLRVLENGNKVHERWGRYFEAMKALHGEEIRLTTEDHDEFPFMLVGRLDMLVDDNVRNVLKAGGTMADVEKMISAPGYEPDLRIIDMKSINPWGFKRVVKDDVAEPEHVMQVAVYMHLTGIHKASIIYEAKDTQEAHEVELTYDERLIFGTEDGKIEGIIPRLLSIAEAVGAAMEGDLSAIPPRCPGASPDAFPCKWKSGNCKFYDHCWNADHQGMKVSGFDTIEIAGLQVDTTKLPAGMTVEMLKLLVQSGAIQGTAAPKATPSQVVAATSAKEEHGDGLPDVLETKFGQPVTQKTNEAVEQKDAGGKFVICPHCEQRVNYQRLGNGGNKKCDYCHEQIKVVREEAAVGA